MITLESSDYLQPKNLPVLVRIFKVSYRQFPCVPSFYLVQFNFEYFEPIDKDNEPTVDILR